MQIRGALHQGVKIARRNTSGEPEVHSVPDAAHGPDADLQEAQHLEAGQSAQDLSLPVGRAAGPMAQSDLLRRYHPSLHAPRVPQPGGHHGLFMRKVLSWRISKTPKADFCIEVLISGDPNRWISRDHECRSGQPVLPKPPTTDTQLLNESKELTSMFARPSSWFEPPADAPFRTGRWLTVDGTDPNPQVVCPHSDEFDPTRDDRKVITAFVVIKERSERPCDLLCGENAATHTRPACRPPSAPKRRGPRFRG